MEKIPYLKINAKDYYDFGLQLGKKLSKQMKARINALEIQRLKERIVIKIIDTQPKTVDELNQFSTETPVPNKTLAQPLGSPALYKFSTSM